MRLNNKEFEKIVKENGNWDKLTTDQKNRVVNGKYSHYFVVAERTYLEVESGKSYFGNGDYSGSFEIAGTPHKKQIGEWDNGFVSGEEGYVVMSAGNIASCVAHDAISREGRRYFANYIAVCA